MANFDILDWSRTKVGDIELDDRVFACPVRPHLHWEVVRWQRAKKRAGTHSTKVRGEVNGTGRKPFKQKGTGRARQGDFRSPLQRGGAVVHGPRPRSYDYPLPAKVRRGALRSALSLLARDQRLLVVRDFGDLGARTRTAAERLQGLGVSKSLIVDTRNSDLKRGVSNLADHKYLAVEGLNVYDLLKFGTLVISEQAARAIEERLQKK